jgi:hypothetical protein
MFCEPFAGELGGPGGSPVGLVDVAVRGPPVIGFARGAPAGGGTIGRAGGAGRCAPGVMPAAASDGDGGIVPCVLGLAAVAGAVAGVLGLAVPPRVLDMGVFAGPTPWVVGFGGDMPGPAGFRTRPVGAIVCSTDGCAVVIDPLSPGSSRSSARSTSSSSSGGNTDSANPSPHSGASARQQL